MNQTPDTLEVLQSGLATLHRMLDEAASDMTLEQLNRKNSDGGVSPFFQSLALCANRRQYYKFCYST